MGDAWLACAYSDRHPYAFVPVLSNAVPVALSSWKFNGISWGQKWFMIANYSAIVIAYAALYFWSKRAKNKFPAKA